MAYYRTVHLSFWTDPGVIDDFSPEDKYFYLYLITNPHTNLAGCYEVSLKQMSLELGYSIEATDALINRFVNQHKLIGYDSETKEVIIFNWHKYNWTESPKFVKALEVEIEAVKNPTFKAYLIGKLNRDDTVSPTDDTVSIHSCIDTSVTVTDTVNNNINNTSKDINKTNTKGLSNTSSKDIEADVQIFGPELSQAVTDWLSYKKERRQSYKDTGLKALVNQIKRNAEKYGEDMLADVIQRSIANRYEGICWSWLKEKPNNKGRNEFFEAARELA